MNRSWKWGWLLLAVPLAIGLSRVRFDTDVLDLLPADLPAVRGLQLYQHDLANRNELILTLSAPNSDSAETAAHQLAVALRRANRLIGRVVWQAPWRDHPKQMAQFVGWLWLNQSPTAVRQLARRLTGTNVMVTLTKAKERLATTFSPAEVAQLGYDPFGFTQLPAAGTGGSLFDENPRTGFGSADGRFRVLFVEPAQALRDYAATGAWLRAVRQVAARCRATPSWPAGIELGYTGTPAFVVEVAQGMQNDLRGSALGTLIVIAVLFGWAHRRWRPLLALGLLLGLILLGTVALGGWLFGRLNVISLGFAAILLGLAVDYALVLYEEARADATLTPTELRRRVGPSIRWSAITTAAAFCLLNFAGLPGLRQLGTLVAIGVLLAAMVMLWLFLPLARYHQRSPASARAAGADDAVSSVPYEPGRPFTPSLSPDGGEGARRAGEGESVFMGHERVRKEHGASHDPSSARAGKRFHWSPLLAWLTTVVLVAFCAVTLTRSWPPIERSTRPLNPVNSPAATALATMQSQLAEGSNSAWLVVTGQSTAAVLRRLERADYRLRQARRAGKIAGYQLPLALWPRPTWQQANRPILTQLAGRATALESAARQAGFTTNAVALAQGVLAYWHSVAGATNVIWPHDPSSRWLLDRFAARIPGGWLALGSLRGDLNHRELAGLQLPGVLVASWSALGAALVNRVEARVVWLTFGMGVVLLGSLYLAFRSVRAVGLSLATLGFSLALLLTVMALAGWSWNLLNLTALPLLLGAGVDYTIHVQLALRRHNQDIAQMRRVTGRALFLCAATTMVGFGSLAWSGNAGLASLGQVCAVGVLAMFFTALFLLPTWSYPKSSEPMTS